MLLVLLIVAGACSTDPPAATTSSAAATTQVAVTTTPVVSSPVTTVPADVVPVVDVTDGDTLAVELPGGRAVVRLIGVNTPEAGECFADAATAALERLVEDGPVRLVRDESDTDQFDRLLRFVETPEGIDVGAELVRGGFAVSRRYEPDIARNDEYDRLQAEAQQASRGLWASDACGAPAAGGTDIAIEVEPDPPGDDTLNLNGEWVRFTNRGSTTLDLTGWEVADESASNRYRFGALTVAPGAAVTLFSGCGTDTDTERFWCSERSAIWNNAGDTVLLRDRNGSTVASLSYRR